MNKVLRRIYMILLYLFLYAPIIVLIVFSFNEGKTRGSWDGFTFDWYRALLEDAEILAALKNTLLIALTSSLVSTIIGTLGALGIYYLRRQPRAALLGINQIPVMNPDIVAAVGFMILYRVLDIELGFGSLLLSHIGFTVPYVILNVMPKLKTMPRALPEAAQDLGATPWQTLYLVVLPYLKTGIISGALMAFTLSLDDFVISFFNTGNGVETVSTQVYSMARRGINPSINALSTLMFVAMIFLLGMINVLTPEATER